MNEQTRSQLYATLAALRPSIPKSGGFFGDHYCHFKVGQSLNEVRQALLRAAPPAERELLEPVIPALDVDVPAKKGRNEYTVDLDEALRLFNLLEQHLTAPQTPRPNNAPAPVGESASAGMKLFISHSSADEVAAEAFVGFLRAALNLGAKDIRCTSVDGHQLTVGANVDDQLRQEVFEAQAFVALLSPQSLQSSYVMFELGARWGARRYLAPVTISGILPAALKAPLSAVHGVNGASETHMHQLIEELAERLGTTLEKPSSYDKALKRFVAAASTHT
jgi:hypothetical protein